MNSSPQEQQSNYLLISSTVVVNIIWWMVMIAAIGIGATHLGLCPAQPSIPMYLIVLGVVSLIALSLTYTRGTWDDGYGCILNSFCMSFLYILTIGWFIAGTTWVYRVYPPDYAPGATRYCEKITYQFAFVVTTVVWSVLILMFICAFCFALMTCCKTVKARRRLIPNRNTYGYGAISEEPIAGDV